MKRIVIIEDEPFAADHLAELIRQLQPETEVLAQLPTVNAAVQWLQTHQDYDLVLSDIQLGDGICFEIFSQVDVQAPIIFTTAYDQYALRAFKVNSVDYLLKPVDKPSLQAAFDKLQRLQETGGAGAATLTAAQLQQLLRSMRPEFKERFAVQIGSHLKLVPASEVLYFESKHKLTYLITEEGKRYPVPYTLRELEDQLDPKHFFRINRQMLLHYRAILDVAAITNSRLKVKISQGQPAVVSRERCADFRTWLEGY